TPYVVPAEEVESTVKALKPQIADGTVSIELKGQIKETVKPQIDKIIKEAKPTRRVPKLTLTPETKVEDSLQKGSKILWDVFGNQKKSEWEVGDRVKTKGGQDAVNLSRTENGKVVTRTVALSDLIGTAEDTPTGIEEVKGEDIVPEK
ncbi:hypothetical protein, partial [Salmonella enterica]|uniref:hypothetical protein n=1 Tax=Salmonella enterica TaxID=28901 RepID=UPI001386A953